MGINNYYIKGLIEIGKLFDLTGERFGLLTVVAFSHSKNNKSYWMCVCDCGNEKIGRSDSLKRGELKSCKCLNSAPKIGTHRLTGTKLYGVWATMKQRCLNPNDKNYHQYGGRGIKVCDGWISFETFYQWAINNGYDDNLTIERIDVNGNYEPYNCTWITQSQQTLNTRRSLILEYDNKQMTLKEWSIYLNVDYMFLYNRLRKGMSLEEILKSL